MLSPTNLVTLTEEDKASQESESSCGRINTKATLEKTPTGKDNQFTPNRKLIDEDSLQELNASVMRRKNQLEDSAEEFKSDIISQKQKKALRGAM